VNAVVARVLAGATVAAAAGVLAGPPATAVAGGLLLGLALPGLALTATLFPGRALTAVERTVLAPALSLAVLVLGGLVIYVSGYALDRTAWTVATAGVTLLALIVPAVPLPRRAGKAEAARAAEIAELAAAAKLAVQDASRGVGEQRVRMTPVEDTVRLRLDDATVLLPVVRDADPAPVVPPMTPVRRTERPPLRRIARQLVPMILVLAVLGGASWLSFYSSRNTYDATVTALSATPPGAADATGGRTVTVTVSGLVAADGPYRVAVVDPDGTQTSTRTVPVPGGGTWTANLPVGRVRTAITLYRAGDTAAYRTLYVAAAD
jgi:Protein of unknown function (DUF1616)